MSGMLKASRAATQSRRSMPASRAMHVPMRQAQIRQMRDRHQAATHGNQHCMHNCAVLELDEDSSEQQSDARQQKPERTKILVTAETDRQRGQREHAGESYERMFETVIG